MSFRFNAFELQPAQRRLLRDGVPVPLRARAFDLLVALVERAGSLATKAELLELVWPGLIVEENNIAAQIAALRKVLGGDVIATVAGRGYRFTAVVTTIEAHGAAPASLPGAKADRPLDAPPASRLIGRTDDLAHLQASLATPGCVTLVGPGGVGKTVLAREAFAEWPSSQRTWVDLAALADGAQLAGALYRALGVTASGSPIEADAALAAALSKTPFLVVLDNAEHVVDTAASLATALLSIAPTLALLVTSQVPLRIDGERVQPLEPLALPSASSSDDESVATPAVQLLVARLRAADPHRTFEADAPPLLRRLSVRLDGLPLALEMAAAMVPMLGLQGVLDALDQRFAALRRGKRDALPRHQTLRAAVEWSHALLDPDAKRVLHRLAVFPDAFPLDLAIAVAGDDGEDRWKRVDLVTELVQRSLVVRLSSPGTTDPPRFRLLETIRSFALDALRASGEESVVRLRAVVALTDTFRQALSTDTGAQAAGELAHVAELLAWSRSNAPVAAIDLALAAGKVAVWTPWLPEAARWIESGEPLLDTSVPLALQAEWWRDLARFQTFVRGRRTVEAATRACAIERTLGNDAGLFWSLIPLLRACTLEPDAFDACRDEAGALLDRHPEWPPRNRVVFSGSLALEYRRRGDFETAWRHQLDEADEAERAGLREIADNAQSNLVATLNGLGRHDEALSRIDALLARSGDHASPLGAYNRIQKLNALIGLKRLDAAQAFAIEALPWGRRYDVPDIVQVIAQLCALQGRTSVAALLLGHYRQRLAARGADLPADAHSPWKEASTIVEAAIDEATRHRLSAFGEASTPADIDAQILEAFATDAEPRRRTA